MTYSYELIQMLKLKLGIKSDNEAAKFLPKATSGTVSEMKSGKRTLTEEQALFIAEHCALDCALTLVELAAESAKTNTAKTIWHNLAKKLRAAVSSAALVGLLLVSGLTPQSPTLRVRT